MCVRTVTIIVILLATSAPQSGAQDERKCKYTMTNEEMNLWHTPIITYVIAYNISATKISQTCGEAIFNSVDEKKTITVKYKIGGTMFVDIYSLYTENGIEYSSKNGLANLKFYYHVELEPPLLIGYVCEVKSRNLDFIWIGYLLGQDALKEAEAKAKQLTDNPDDYKLDPKGCI